MLKILFENFKNKQAWIIFFLGFSSGMPLVLIGGNLTFWLREEGLSLSNIGLFSLVTLPYVFKFMWAPLLDKVKLPYITYIMGRRRSWMLISQCGLIVSLLFLGASQPQTHIHYTACAAFFIAFFSSCQDITIDAYRIESMPSDQQALGVAFSTFGYRIAMTIAGSGGLAIAHFVSWTASYNVMTLGIVAGVVTMCYAPEIYTEEENALPIDSLRDIQKHNSIRIPSIYAFILKYITYGLGFMALLVYKDLFKFIYEWKEWSVLSILWMYFGMILVIWGVEFGWKKSYGPYHTGVYSSDPIMRWVYTTFLRPFAQIKSHPYWYIILLFILFYRLPDAFIGGMTNPFLVDIGFNKLDVVEIVKLYGLLATLCGAMMGAWLLKKADMWKALMICGILAVLSNLIFVVQEAVGHHIGVLVFTITVENITSSMANIAYMAFLGNLCNLQFTATQYALFSSLASAGRVMFASHAGTVAEILGWHVFFYASLLTAIPGLGLLLLIMFLYKRKKIQI